ncbi:cytochrome P450 [Emcibacter nanhaiensis]|uniref:Cytochrome P450 n=1 Tax=Emcibacter nanhaiensis TaxID=1505037 RepID=A0A501PIJ0_9PROT|nr:cytochrome P450 [Emcibacter nanhaiensis]TPD59868.1 cytochrome P450 [Emcibacter nanhaiensis]
MEQVKDLALPHLPMETPEFAADPIPYFNDAREKHPWLAKCAFGYVITQYDAMKDLLIQDDKMKSALEGIVAIYGAHGTPWGRLTEESIVASSGDVHTQLRNVVTPLFSPRQANANRVYMQEVINRQLNEWLPKGVFDFEEFIAYYPVGVICAMIGADHNEVPRLRSSLETIGRAFSMDPNLVPALNEATEVLDGFVHDLVAERRAGKRPEKGGELLDILIKALDEGGLTERQFYDLLIFLFGAGYDTSKNIMTLMMYEMLQYPEMYERCAVDMAYCEKVTEEAFRYHSVANIPRMTTEEITYRDVHFPVGSMLFFPVSIAGRDPSVFDDADTFDPEKKRSVRHIAFGRGMHICLGQFIARAQIAEGMHLIAQRVKNPKLTGEVTWRPFYGVWGLEGLPIEFEQAPAA